MPFFSSKDIFAKEEIIMFNFMGQKGDKKQVKIKKETSSNIKTN